MSLVRMRKTMHDKLPTIMLLLALVFAVGWIGLVLGSGRNGAVKDTPQSGVIATVNGQKIDREEFETRVRTQLEQQNKQHAISAFEESQMRGQILDSMIDRILRMDAAEQEGVRVSRGDLREKTDQYVDGQIAQLRARVLQGSKDTSDKALDAVLSRNGTSVAKLKDQIRSSVDPEMIREQATMEKLVKQLQAKVDTSDKAVRESYDEVRFSQISITAQGRSMDQAQSRAQQVSDKIKGGEDFAAAAKEFSDDPYKVKGGDRGFFARKAYLDKDLADKVFAMQPGQVSDPIKLPQGFMIVKLDQKRSALPPDYSDPKKQKGYRDAYAAQMQYTVQGEFVANMQKNAKVDVQDPELKAYLATKQMSSMFRPGSTNAAKAKALEAIQDLKQAVQSSTGDSQAMARVFAQMSYIYDWMRKPGMFAPSKEESAKYMAAEKESLQSALDYTESNDLRTMLADINIQEGQYAKALENLKFVSENAYDDPTTHKNLISKYQQIKKYEPQKAAAAIAEEQKWLADYNKMTPNPKMQQQGANVQPLGATPSAQPKPGG